MSIEGMIVSTMVLASWIDLLTLVVGSRVLLAFRPTTSCLGNPLRASGVGT